MLNIQKIYSVFINLHKDLPFLPERKKTEKSKKLVCNIQRKLCCSHKNFKTRLILKIVHRVIQFNQEP